MVPQTLKLNGHGMAAKLSVLKVEKNPLSSKACQLQLVHYHAKLARYLATLVWVKRAGNYV